jgi:membrane-associated phospholipid phosphatase
MLLLVSLIPLYLLLPDIALGEVRRPALAADDLFGLWPAWSLIYGALYLQLILLPVLVVREPRAISKLVHAYLFVWLVSYASFVLYPTAAPRPEQVGGQGFAAWGLRFLYGADPPFNCFPSLHVAHSFVSALVVLKVERRVGAWALGAAILVGLSALYTKQHYVADVVAGGALALLANVLFLSRIDPTRVRPEDRSHAPWHALTCATLSAVGVLVWWLAYRLS